MWQINIFLTCTLAVIVYTVGCKKNIDDDQNPLTVTAQSHHMTYIETFKIAACDKIILEYYRRMSDEQDGVPSQTYAITDKNSLQEICVLLKTLPNKGERMKDMGDVPIINVILDCGQGEKVFFTFFRHRIKTPDNSFYASPPLEAEKKLYTLFTMLLGLKDKEE